jgi:hypothetical protein
MTAAILLATLSVLLVCADLSNKETGYINNNFEETNNQ